MSSLLNDLQIRKERDKVKQELCKKAGITLVQVPYWWDAQRDSLEATIYSYRPDLYTVPPKSAPIPSEPPSSWTQYYERKKGDVSSSLLLASRWHPEDDPNGWYFSTFF